MIILKDAVFAEILEFFDACEFHGRNIPVTTDPFDPNAAQSPVGHHPIGFDMDDQSMTVSSEARLLKALYLGLYD